MIEFVLIAAAAAVSVFVITIVVALWLASWMERTGRWL